MTDSRKFAGVRLYRVRWNGVGVGWHGNFGGTRVTFERDWTGNWTPKVGGRLLSFRASDELDYPSNCESSLAKLVETTVRCLGAPKLTLNG